MTIRPFETCVGYALPTAAILALVAFAGTLSPVERFVGATVGLYVAVKLGSAVLVAAREGAGNRSALRCVLFWLLWPGVRPDRFEVAEEDAAPEARTFVVGYAFALGGLALALVSFLARPVVGMAASTWLLLLAIFAVVHSGIGRLLPFGLRWIGIAVPPLFDDPLRSSSVAEFWSARWNRPFIGMNRLFVTEPLAGRIGTSGAVAAGFAVSALLHELAISYPAGAGWGGPAAYFLLQAAFFGAERSLLGRPNGDYPWLRRAWTLLAVLGPLPLLFHGPFRMTFLAPVVEAGRALLAGPPLSAYVGTALWVGAAGHLLVLVASFQVPDELEWNSDLASLKPLNRKLLWTYGGYIVLMIVAFGTMTALLHRHFLAGTPVALGLCALIAMFWTIRVAVDALYFEQDDWPDGLPYVVGHTLLTSLFALLIAIYGGTLAAHLVGAV